MMVRLVDQHLDLARGGYRGGHFDLQPFSGDVAGACAIRVEAEFGGTLLDRQLDIEVGLKALLATPFGLFGGGGINIQAIARSKGFDYSLATP